MSEAFPVIITMVVGFIGALMGLAMLFLWLLAREEGRFFMKRSLDNKGIDVIRHEPLSNRLRLITVHWTGKYFKFGKEMIFFGIEKLINPKTPPQVYYNEVISRMCTWAGCRRPVLLATDILSHIANPDLLSVVAKAKLEAKYAEAKQTVKDYIALLESSADGDHTITSVSFLETIKPDDLTEFMEDVGARDAYQVYELGKRVNELERAKGMQLPGAAKIVVSVAFIGLVLLLVYLVATGRLNEIIGTVAK